MKKWFITFCALGLISTQAQVASAASSQEEAKAKAIKHEVKVMNMDQYEDLLAQFKKDLTFKEVHGYQNLSSKLMMSHENLENLIAAQLKECNVNVGKSVPSVNETTDEKVVQKDGKLDTPEIAAPEAVVTEANKGQESVTPQVPVTEQSTPSAPSEEVGETTPTTSVTEADSVSAFETQVVELTNAERAKNGLAPLKIYNPLMKVAHEKSQDMATNNYFSHTSPTYGSPFDQIKAAGITYSAAGENIAQGQRTPQEVVQAWMDSEGHRANILNGSFTHIGVGYVGNGNYWTQQFIQL